MLNSEVPCVRYLIGRIVKTYDYINRVVLTLPLSVYEGTWTHSPLSLLCITMILRVRRNFFEITMFPNSAVPPSTIFHLGHIVAVLRRSPASVEHHHRHHAVVLTELSLKARLDRSSRDVIELNVC